MSDQNDKRIEKLEQKLDAIIEKLHDQHIVLVKNTESLIIHMKRTDINEARIEAIEECLIQKQGEFEVKLDKMQDDIEPIKAHVNIVNVVFKYVLPAVGALILFGVKFLSSIR